MDTGVAKHLDETPVFFLRHPFLVIRDVKFYLFFLISRIYKQKIGPLSARFSEYIFIPSGKAKDSQNIF